MKIEKTTAFLVNLSDSKGDRLVSESDVRTLISDRLGAIIDGMGLTFVGAREKLALHDAIMDNLAEVAGVCEMARAYHAAKIED